MENTDPSPVFVAGVRRYRHTICSGPPGEPEVPRVERMAGLLREGNALQVIAECLPDVESVPEDSDILNALVWALIITGQIELAERLNTIAIRRYREMGKFAVEAVAMVYAGAIAWRKTGFAQAKSLLLEAMQIDPAAITPYWNLLCYSSKSQNIDELQQATKIFLDQFPNFFEDETWIHILTEDGDLAWARSQDSFKQVMQLLQKGQRTP